ncbi:BEN domain-containing protein 5-like [Ischnura elegans]|uniref:BEN domain-containing protein 5-like n=1 Tax=Ischnura elegans TaxID=197161 RepID=UPI001ED89A08|nr:BEN domain-containing protein 5-like [Ischnura elegans]
MDSNRMSCIYQKFSLRNSNNVNGNGKKDTERGSFRSKRRHLDLMTDSSLDYTSSSSDTDGEVSKLREENKRLRKMAKHYRRKYLNAKERYKDVSSLNVELQKRLFGMAAPVPTAYEASTSSMNYNMAQQQGIPGQHYLVTQNHDSVMQQHALVADDSEQSRSLAVYNNVEEDEPEVPQDVDIKGHNMYMEFVPHTEPVCEISQTDDNDGAILSDDKLKAASCVRSGQAGDSLFVKNLALAIWGPETLACRSVTGKRCTAIQDSVPKPPLSPKKLDYIKEKFVQRIRHHEPNATQDEICKRAQKIRIYLADKIATLNRKPNFAV